MKSVRQDSIIELTSPWGSISSPSVFILDSFAFSFQRQKMCESHKNVVCFDISNWDFGRFSQQFWKSVIRWGFLFLIVYLKDWSHISDIYVRKNVDSGSAGYWQTGKITFPLWLLVISFSTNFSLIFAWSTFKGFMLTNIP